MPKLTKCPCKQHPDYRAIRVPRGDCDACWAFFAAEIRRRYWKGLVAIMTRPHQFPHNMGETERIIDK